MYFDFAKAFDSVSHPKLMFKLSYLGLPDNLLQTINSFLLGRSQRVSIDNVLSETLPVCSGVPQGSVLGPILFLIFVNDLTESVLPSSISKVFTDDLKLFHIVRSDADVAVLQSNVDAVWQWSVDWQLAISVKKCSVIDYGRSGSTVATHLNNYVLPVMSSVTDLGVIFNCTLSFTDHIACIVNRAKIRCNMLYRCFITMSANFLVKGFISYIRPILEYCCQVWSPVKRADIDLIESVQRNFTKRLTNLKHMPYSERLTTLGLRSLEERRLRLDLVFCFNILHSFNCITPADIGIILSTCSTRGHALKLTVLHSNVTSRANFFANRVVCVWNGLPHHVIVCESTAAFKRSLDKVDLSNFVTQFDYA